MELHGRPRVIALLGAAIALVLVSYPGAILPASTPATPIPDSGSAGPAFVGMSGRGRRVQARRVPRHPFMARNGRSNIHDDAYMSDTYRVRGPIGRNMQRTSAFFPPGAVCGSVAFDRLGRIVSVCVSSTRPTLRLFDPLTLAQLASMDLPPRTPSPNPFQDFSGGGYFYLDNQDRAVTPTTTRHIWVVGETSGPLGPGFALQRDYDLELPPAQATTLRSVEAVLGEMSGKSLEEAVSAPPGDAADLSLPLEIARHYWRI